MPEKSQEVPEADQSRRFFHSQAFMSSKNCCGDRDKLGDLEEAQTILAA